MRRRIPQRRRAVAWCGRSVKGGGAICGSTGRRAVTDRLLPFLHRYHVPRDSPEWTAGVERAQMCVLMRVTRRRELCSLLTLLPCSLTVTSPGSSTQRKCLRTASLSLPFAISSPSPFLPHPQRPVLRPRPNPHAPIQQHPLAPQPRRGPLGRRARWRRRRRCGRGRRRRDADGEWAAKEEGRQVR